jgi:hypothetical protein
MELDDFKNAWNEMGNQQKETTTVNLKKIDTMSKRKTYTLLKKILLPEILGSAICIGCALFIGFNFYTLDTIAYQISGVLGIVLCLILSAISLMSIRKLYQPVDAGKPYAETLKEFAVNKIRFCKLQKLNITLSYLFFVTVILLLPKILGRTNFAGSYLYFLCSYTLGYSLLLLFSKWVFRSYNNTIRQTENLLNELAS